MLGWSTNGFVCLCPCLLNGVFAQRTKPYLSSSLMCPHIVPGFSTSQIWANFGHTSDTPRIWYCLLSFSGWCICVSACVCVSLRVVGGLVGCFVCLQAGPSSAGAWNLWRRRAPRPSPLADRAKGPRRYEGGLLRKLFGTAGTTLSSDLTQPILSGA